jgi:hypothetical protein
MLQKNSLIGLVTRSTQCGPCNTKFQRWPRELDAGLHLDGMQDGPWIQGYCLGQKQTGNYEDIHLIDWSRILGLRCNYSRYYRGVFEKKKLFILV